MDPSGVPVWEVNPSGVPAWDVTFRGGGRSGACVGGKNDRIVTSSLLIAPSAPSSSVHPTSTLPRRGSPARVAKVRHVIDGSRDLCRRDGRGRRDTQPHDRRSLGAVSLTHCWGIHKKAGGIYMQRGVQVNAHLFG